jgi:hypothetical protein
MFGSVFIIIIILKNKTKTNMILKKTEKNTQFS